MRVSPAAFQLFLLGCVASNSADAFTQPRWGSSFRPLKSNNRHHHREAASKVVLREQKEKSFLDYFRFEPDPNLRKSLGIQEDADAAVPHPPSVPPPGNYFSEDTSGKLLSIPYDAAAKLAFESSTKTMSYANFQQQFEADAVADVMRKNGRSEEQITAKMEELNQPTTSFLATSKATKVVVDTFVSPLIGPEIEKGVPIKTIQGACLTAAVLSLFYTADLTISALAVLLTAFITITPGPLGDVARFVGSFINGTGENLILFSDKVGLTDTIASQTLVELPKKPYAVDLDEDVRDVLKEAEDAIASTEPQVDLSIPYDAAARLAYDASDKTLEYDAFKAKFEAGAVADVISKKEKELAEQVQLEEEKKLEAEKKRAEEARLAAIEEEATQKIEKDRLAKLAVEQRLLEEARQAEEDRVAEEKQLAAEEARLAEEARKADDEKLAAEEARIAEEARKVEEDRLAAEEARLAEEQRIAAEEEEAAKQAALDPEIDDDGGFDDDMDWEATIDMAKDNVDGNIVGIDVGDADQSAKQDWDAAGKFAQSLGDQPPQPFNDEVPDEELARAAREAVAKYEQQNVKNTYDDEDSEDDEDFSDLVLDDEPSAEDVAAAARMAVDMFNNMQGAEGDSDDDDFGDIFFDEDFSAESAPQQQLSSSPASTSAPTQNWSKLKVAELRDELKSRGLPTTGKKAELVAMLETDDNMNSMAGGKDAEADSEDDGDDDLFESLSSMVADEMPKSSSMDDVFTDLSAKELEEMAKAAREAVDLFDGEEPSDEILMRLENEGLDLGDDEDDDSDDLLEAGDNVVKGSVDYASMTVVELKDELRNRGLKSSGKKAELIQRLQSSG